MSAIARDGSTGSRPSKPLREAKPNIASTRVERLLVSRAHLPVHAEAGLTPVPERVAAACFGRAISRRSHGETPRCGRPDPPHSARDRAPRDHHLRHLRVEAATRQPLRRDLVRHLARHRPNAPAGDDTAPLPLRALLEPGEPPPLDGILAPAGDPAPRSCAPSSAGHYGGNRPLMLSRSWMRRIASPKSGATEPTSTFGDSVIG